MTPLRKKMVEAMHMRGFAVRTHETYLAVVSDLARFHRRCPSTLSRADLEQYFRHLVLERELSAASCRVHLHAIRFLYCAVLGHASFDVAFTLPSKRNRPANRGG